MRSGKTYYYFDTGAKPRVEIPLGADYYIALQKWSQLMGKNKTVAVADFESLAAKYEREIVPLKASSTQKVNVGDLKLLRKFFCTPKPAPLDQIKPQHIHQMLQWQSKTPSQANRLKALFSTMFNQARAWGYTDKQNPCEGIRGLKAKPLHAKITDDEAYNAILQAAKPHLREAMQLAYLTGQRPNDVLNMSDGDAQNGYLTVGQSKTGKQLRIVIAGELAALIERIQERKAQSKWHCDYLLTNATGRKLTKQMLRDAWDDARETAASITKDKALAERIRGMWFRDLRAKASDDVADMHGIKAASQLLGHTSEGVTKRHYRTRGDIVPAVA